MTMLSNPLQNLITHAQLLSHKLRCNISVTDEQKKFVTTSTAHREGEKWNRRVAKLKLSLHNKWRTWITWTFNFAPAVCYELESVVKLNRSLFVVEQLESVAEGENSVNWAAEEMLPHLNEAQNNWINCRTFMNDKVCSNLDNEKKYFSVFLKKWENEQKFWRKHFVGKIH